MQLTSTLRQRKSGVAPCSNVRSDPAVDLDDRCTTSANGTVKTAPGKGAPPAKRMTQAGGFAVAFLWFVLLNLFALWARQRTPPFLPASAPPHIFSGQRALDRVAGLCGSFRYVGTLALHQATQELAKQVQELKELAEHFSKDRFVFEYDVQRVDGSFALNIRSFHDLLIAQSYESITNIAIRIYPRELGPDARTLVVNSHYDTAAGSPGCVDATAAIGTMMEMVSGLVHAYDDETCAQDPEHMKACAERQLTHPVVFLLNGAEEVFLVGAHGFVTKHPYMDATSLLLNLEASGASGPALLFRCGPGHGWMARTYAKAVPLPHASCASQDIMNLDLFPAETDHRVFVEYGGLSGFDIASYENGYVYHTKYDNLENAGRGFIQHLGETATSLMTELVGKNAAIEMNGMSDHRAQERMVFFDIFGLFTVVYSMQFAWYLNVATCLAVLAVVTMRTKRAVKGCSPPVHLLQCFFFGIALLLACAGTGSIAGLLLRYVARRPLAWYGLENEWLMIPLFAFPACTVLLVLVDAFCRRSVVVDSFELVQQVFVVFCALCCTLFTSANLGMAYIPMLNMVFALVSFTLKNKVLRSMVASIPFSLGIMVNGTVLGSFPAIMGRAGVKSQPDLFIGVLVALCTYVFFAAPWLALLSELRVRTLRLVSVALMSVWLAAMVFVYLTMEHGPYSQAAPKRMFVNHFEGDEHNALFVSAWDPIPLESMSSFKEPMASVFGMAQPASTLTWGGPMNVSGWEGLRPFSSMLDGVRYGPLNESHGLAPVRLRVLSDVSDTSNDHRRLELELSSQDSHQLMIRLDNCHILEWPYTPYVPRSNPHFGGYVIRHTGTTWQTPRAASDIKEPASQEHHHTQTLRLALVLQGAHCNLHVVCVAARLGRSSVTRQVEQLLPPRFAPVFLLTSGSTFSL